ncbi:MAG: RedB protein [Planctomycetota bacterium]
MKLAGHRVLAMQTTVWAAASLAGLAWLTDYSSVPGVAATSPVAWPQRADLQRDDRQPTLLMFLHPHCPCSQASLSELARVAVQVRERMRMQVLFVQPDGCAPDWYRTSLWTSARDIPGVLVDVDLRGHLAGQFGAKTSGQTLVYDRAGTLVFRGGLTPGRGHEGDSPGRTAVLSLLEERTRGSTMECSAFGCPLLTERAEQR